MENEYNWQTRKDSRSWKKNIKQYVWGLSRCTNSECRTIHNRDVNSSSNILEISRSHLDGNGRPECFKRTNHSHAVKDSIPVMQSRVLVRWRQSLLNKTSPYTELKPILSVLTIGNNNCCAGTITTFTSVSFAFLIATFLPMIFISRSIFFIRVSSMVSAFTHTYNRKRFKDI